jgi:hypothetical protein
VNALSLNIQTATGLLEIGGNITKKNNNSFSNILNAIHKLCQNKTRK